jgi:hypothetical protein
MTRLIVHAPPTYTAERRYILGVVLTERLGLDFDLVAHDSQAVRLTALDDPIGRSLTMPDVLFGTPRSSWLTSTCLPAQPLRRWRVEDDLPDAAPASPLPILFGEPLPSERWLTQRAADLHLRVDVLGTVFFLLTRMEEVVIEERDEHDRFPSTNSVLQQEDVLLRPIGDEHIEVLWACLQRQWAQLQRRSFGYSVFLSHDVDMPTACAPVTLQRAVRASAHDVLSGEPGLALRRFQAHLHLMIGGSDVRDPADTFAFIMDTSDRVGLQSSFNMMAGGSVAPFEGYYALDDPKIVRLARMIHGRGHLLGFHPSYGTYRDPELLKAEFTRLLRFADAHGVTQKVWGGRQHYLRWSNPDTWQAWEDAGLAFDSTLGYADRAGFRCGTCHPFPVFNLHTGSPLALVERPLHVMDATVINYMRLDDDACLDLTEQIATACRRYRGEFALLWHNWPLLGTRGLQNLYANVIDLITAGT